MRTSKLAERIASKAVPIVLFMLIAGPGSVVACGMIVPSSSMEYPVIKYHHVTVTIDNQYAVTEVDQEFYNPYDEEMTGTYIFPVPEGAFVSDFTLIIDGVEYHAESYNRDEARELFKQAVSEMEDASLLEYVGQNVFAIEVTIPPKGTRRIQLRYEEFLIQWGGLYRYAYTLSTEQYSAADIEDVTVTVNISSENGVQNVYSPTHDVTIEQISETSVRVEYVAQNVRPDKDFELYFAASDNAYGAGLLNYIENRDGYLLFTFTPNPADFDTVYIPKDIVFVIDKSGSMSGDKIRQAKDALMFIIQQLGESDKFTIISFESYLHKFSDELMAVNNANISNALEYVDGLYAGGGTNINEGLLTALDLFNDSTYSDHTKIIVFLTDGQPTVGVTNENQIATNVKNANAEVNASIHVFGVGYDVNTHLLDKLSSQNNGSSTYVAPNESLENALVDFYSKIQDPILTDITVTFSGLDVSEVYPSEIPDLFEGSQLILVGRYTIDDDITVVENRIIDDVSGELGRDYFVFNVVIEEDGEQEPVILTVHIQGDTSSGSVELQYDFDLTYIDSHDFIPRLWATRKIGDLVNQIRLNGETDELVEEIRELGTKYGIVTPYTSMLITAEVDTANASIQQNMTDREVLSQPTGAASFGNAAATQVYVGALQASVSQGANITAQGGKTFVDLHGTQVDMDLLRGVTTIALDNQTADEWITTNVNVTRKLRFGSDEYFELAEDEELAEIMAAGSEAVFSHNGEIIQVSKGFSAAGDQDEATITSGAGNSEIGIIVSMVSLSLAAAMLAAAAALHRRRCSR